jgi:hypothetical protein
LHELKTSYSNSGFVTTPYEHLFEKEGPPPVDRRETEMETRTLNHSMSDGYKLRAEIEGSPWLIKDRDLDGLVKLRNKQRQAYETQIEGLRSQALDNNRTIAMLKAQILHYKAHQK